MKARMIRLREEGVPTINPTVLDELRQYEGESGTLADELTQLFLDETPGLVLSLNQALQNSDFPEIVRCSHRLKGSAGAIGAECFRAICEDVEHDARCCRVTEHEGCSAVIEEELRNLREALLSCPKQESSRS